MSGDSFVERIDLVLKENNIKRQTLADTVGFDSSTLAQWKNKGRLPDLQTAYGIASFLHVSVEWLLTGQLSQEWAQAMENGITPMHIVRRIEDQIESITQDFSKEFDVTFFSIIDDCVSYEEIKSWVNNRLEPSIFKLLLISKKLTLPIQYLLTGVDPRVPAVDQHVIRLAEKYPSQLRYYDCLPEEDKQTVNRVIEALFHITR